MSFLLENQEFNITLVTGSPPPSQSILDVELNIPDIYLLDIRQRYTDQINLINDIQNADDISAAISILTGFVRGAANIIGKIFKVSVSELTEVNVGDYADEWLDYLTESVEQINFILENRADTQLR